MGQVDPVLILVTIGERVQALTRTLVSALVARWDHRRVVGSLISVLMLRARLQASKIQTESKMINTSKLVIFS